jgi:hypothetical protein
MNDIRFTLTLLGFIDQARFVLRGEQGFKSSLQIRNAIDGAVAHNSDPSEPMAPGPQSIALSTNARFAAVGGDRRIALYTLDNNMPTAQFSPTPLPYRVMSLSFSPDGNQLAMFAIVQDTATVLSFKAQRGDNIATSIINTTHQPAVNNADPEADPACNNELLWLQNGATWLVAGTKLIESSSGREIGTINAPGVTNQYYVGNGQLIFVGPSPTGTGFDGIAAKLDDAKVKATLDKLR